jgi:hypothetical protein
MSSVSRARARMAWARGAVRGLLLLAVTIAPSASRAATLDPHRFISVDEIHAGQHAVGRTVFVGRKIEEFELEIVGVVKGGKADGDMILARAIGPRLEHDGIAAGMSGSPIYIDGRLAGALAFGWPFTRDPLCGITPIAEMLDVMGEPDGTPAGDFGARGITPPGGFERLRTPLVAGGLTPAARAMLQPWADAQGFVLEEGGVSAGAGRGAFASAPSDAAGRAAIVPGASISVDLMRGDMNLSAIGTLTWRDGDRVAAFGHPFFQAGDVSFPLGLADITTIVASDLNSFKLGTPGEQLGTITQDRRAAIAGQVGAVPSMLPFTVRMHGPEGDDTYRLWMVRHRQFAPLLAATGVVGALTARGGALAEATWRWRATLSLQGGKVVTLEDVTAGNIAGAGSLYASIMSLLLDNPFAPLSADSLALDIELRPGIARTQVQSVRVEPRVVRPGDPVHVTAELRDYRGATHFEHFDLVVPLNAPEGRAAIAIGGGPELDKQEASRLPGRFRVNSLADLYARIADRRRDDHLYAALYAPGLETTSDGESHPDLPVFAQRLLASDRVVDPTDPLGSLSRYAQASKDLAEPVDGILSIAIEVRTQPVPNALAPSGDRRASLFRTFIMPDSKEDE